MPYIVVFCFTMQKYTKYLNCLKLFQQLSVFDLFEDAHLTDRDLVQTS